MSEHKPVVRVKGLDGDTASVLVACRKVLGHAKAKELWRRVSRAKDFSEALAICGDYVTFA